MGYFVWAGTIIYGHERKIQIFDTTIKLKEVFEAVVHFTFILISQLGFLVPVLSEIPLHNSFFVLYTHPQRQCSHRFKIATMCPPIFLLH